MVLLLLYLGQISSTCSTSSCTLRLHCSQFGELENFILWLCLFSLVWLSLNLVRTTSIGLLLCLVWCQGSILVLIFPSARVCFSVFHSVILSRWVVFLTLMFISFVSIGYPPSTSKLCASFAILSAISFPWMLQWLGIHCNERFHFSFLVF